MYSGSAFLLVVLINLMKFLDYVHLTANRSANETHFTATEINGLVMYFQCFIRVRQGTHFTAHGLSSTVQRTVKSSLLTPWRHITDRNYSSTHPLTSSFSGGKWSAYGPWQHHARGKRLQYRPKGRSDGFYRTLDGLRKSKTRPASRESVTQDANWTLYGVLYTGS